MNSASMPPHHKLLVGRRVARVVVWPGWWWRSYWLSCADVLRTLDCLLRMYAVRLASLLAYVGEGQI